MRPLIESLPESYRGSQEISEMQAAFEKWASKLHEDRDGLFEQFGVRTATWGLSLWEAALGIETDISRPNGFRRARIESKLRGLGTTTKAMIKRVAESFSNGEVEVIEHNGEYSFEVVFAGTVGVPPNMDDLTSAIEEIKPAHLAYAYTYIYRTWEMVSSMTWDEAGARAWDELREGTL